MRELKIRWQRLVDDSGNTCERCGMTEVAVDNAVIRRWRISKPFVKQIQSAIASKLYHNNEKQAK